MGMNLDHTEKNGRRYTAFLRPLIERDYRHSPPELVERDIHRHRRGMHVSRPGKMDILIRLGPERETTMKSLLRNSDVKVWHNRKSIPENPFSYHYHFTTLHVVE
jgi:hypothetical protein